jgi:hypothetical protein
MRTAAIITFSRRLFIEVEMCPVHIPHIREAKIAKETHDLWGRTVPPQGFGRQRGRAEKGDRSVNIAWESKQYFHLKTLAR